MPWHHIGEAMATVKTTKESWCEAEINRIAGEIALMSRDRAAAKGGSCICSARSQSPANNKRSPGNCAPQ